MMIDDRDKDIANLRRKLIEVKMSVTIKSKAVSKENELAQENLESNKKMCDFHAERNKNLHIKVDKLTKAIENARSEIQLLKDENKRLELSKVTLYIKSRLNKTKNSIG